MVALVADVEVVVKLEKVEGRAARKAVGQARGRGAGRDKSKGRLIVGIQPQGIIDAKSRQRGQRELGMAGIARDVLGKIVAVDDL